MSARKKLAVAIAALIVAFLFLTVPSYRSGKVLMDGNVTLNSTGYYEQYYGSNVTVEFNEQYLEFRSPADAFNYYCEPSFPSLQVGVFLERYLGYGDTARTERAGNTSAPAADGSTAADEGGYASGSSNDGSAADGSTSLDKNANSVCYGIKTPLPETGYESYGQAYYACYGFRVAERAGCLYG